MPRHNGHTVRPPRQRRTPRTPEAEPLPDYFRKPRREHVTATEPVEAAVEYVEPVVPDRFRLVAEVNPLTEARQEARRARAAEDTAERTARTRQREGKGAPGTNTPAPGTNTPAPGTNTPAPVLTTPAPGDGTPSPVAHGVNVEPITRDDLYSVLRQGMGGKRPTRRALDFAEHADAVLLDAIRTSTVQPPAPAYLWQRLGFARLSHDGLGNGNVRGIERALIEHRLPRETTPAPVEGVPGA